MKRFRFLQRKKFWKRLFIYLVLLPVFLIFVLVLILYWKQDAIVQDLLTTLNKDFKGEIRIKGSHISPFENFPYISIDLEGVEIYEAKNDTKHPILKVSDVYVGFDLFTVLSGKTDIKTIKAKTGKIFLTQHKDGSFNIANALSSPKPINNPKEEFHLDLQSIKLEDIEIRKLNEANNLLVDVNVKNAGSSFKTSGGHINATIDSKFVMSIVKDGKPTIIREKHIDFETEIDYNEKKHTARISPTEVHLENAFFGIEGSFDVLDDMNLNLNFKGDKPNFNLFIALAPPELIKVFEQYENRGKLYFKASVKGKSINGHTPAIRADFGCKDAFFNNEATHKKVDGIRFKGYFTNGAKRSPETMEFAIADFSAKPETGKFTGFIKVNNFVSPNIHMQLVSDFNLDFLAKFVNSADLKGLKGGVKLTMNFRDIIDLNNPERSIRKLNESYYSKLEVKNLQFNSKKLPYVIKDIDLLAEVKGHATTLNYCNIRVGNTDLKIDGSVSDLPAIVHHTDLPVTTHLNIRSHLVDLHELTKTEKEQAAAVDEQLEDLRLKLSFVTSARNLTESPNLPVGEFYIDDLYAKLKHYPHKLHDFHADVLIQENDFNVVDFTGAIDNSDFHFSGGLHNYNMWFDEKLNGDTRIDFDLTSEKLKLEDLFVYKGENFVPEDYRHEELDQLKLHGNARLHFNHGLKSTDLQLDRFGAKMKMHHSRIEHMKGRIHFEDEHLVVQHLDAKIGRSSMLVDLNYYLGKNEAIRKRDNLLKISATRLDFDELMNYNTGSNAKPAGETAIAIDHDKGFSIYDLPFPEMHYELHIDHLNYHKYHLSAIDAKMHSKTNHYLYIDKLNMHAAGGEFRINGYFSGIDKQHIYFRPTITMKHVNLDQLMFKFDNFGQDHLVSENLHGQLSGTLKGKIHMHADMTPKLDDSELHLDIEVLKGRLENYAPMHSLAEYFQDKNLNKILFDSLVNKLDMKNGVLTIPRMGINTSLGYMEFSGTQDLHMNMEYYVSVPLAMVTQVGFKKLFGRKKEEVDPDQEDAVMYRDKEKKMRFITVKLTGDANNYSVALSKEKKHK